MEKLFFDHFFGPFGNIFIVVSNLGAEKIFLTESHWNQCKNKHLLVHDPEKCYNAISQLKEYFEGSRKEFTCSMHIQGSTFNQKVWSAIRSVTYGTTASYNQIAKAIGQPSAARAVGHANKSNPLPIFIPCHRIIAKNGNLTGYLGNNLDLKNYLLELEKHHDSQ